MMIKNEQNIIKQNLNWHYQLGIKYFVIIDNGSSDNTLTLLQEFAKKDVSLEIIQDSQIGLEKDKKVTQAYHIALDKFKPHWIFILDADEFIQPAKIPIQEIMYYLNKQLQIEQFENTFLHGVAKDYLQQLQEQPLGLRITWRNYKTLLEINQNMLRPFKIPPLKEKFPSDFYLYDYNNCPSKVSLAAKKDIFITQGHHDAIYNNHLIYCIDAEIFGLTISHYPILDYQHFKEKYIKGGSAYKQKLNSPPAEGKYWKMIYRAYLMEGENALKLIYQHYVERNRLLLDKLKG